MTSAPRHRGATCWLAALALLAAAPVHAQTSGAAQPKAWNDLVVGGTNAYQRGDYVTALRLFGEAAQATPPDANSIRANNLLGDMYSNGRGVPQDDRTALRYFSQAAASGDARANFNVGVVEARLHALDAAFAAFLKAAQLGYARAQAVVAQAYELGNATARDPVQAVEWYRKSSDQNDPIGEFGLAYAYASGSGGLAKDPTRAAYLYRLSAVQGYAPAETNLAQLYGRGEGVPLDHVEATRWYCLAAEQEVPNAMDGCGYSLEKGYGVARDVAAAKSWYERAAQFGQPEAMHNLAGLYLRGDGVTADRGEALYWGLLAYRFYSPGEKRDGLQRLLVRLEEQLPVETQLPIRARAEAFVAKKPPAPDTPLLQRAAVYSSFRDRLRRDPKFQIYRALFAVALDADGEVLSLRLVNVFDPAISPTDPVDVTVPSSYVEAVRAELTKKPLPNLPAGKPVTFSIAYYFSPSYPATVIANLDAGPDNQP